MKDKFQSKAVPRGTRTIWRYLGALFILFTFAVGNVWGANVVVTFKGATTKDAKSTALTPTISSSDANITVGACASICSTTGYVISTYDGKTAILGDVAYYLAQPYQSGSKMYWKDAGANFYGTFTIPSGYKYTIKGVNHALAAVSSSNFTATITVKDATTTKYTSASLSIANKSSGATITSTAINLEEANWVVLAAGTYTINVTPSNTSDASSGKYFGIAEVALTGDLESAVPATNYTVTIDPNGGSYASTPDGWTYSSAGVYTKEIAGGTSFTAPAGLTKGTDDLSWKDGADNVVTFPVTISDDITFVAQWAPHAASSDATLSALSVAGLTLNETFDPATTAYTANLPFYGVMPTASAVTATKNDSHASDPVVSVSGNVISVEVTPESGAGDKKTYTITVNIADAPTASSSINIEQAVLDHGTGYNIGAALTTANISYVDKDALDSLKNQTGRNEPYLGLKFKKTTSKVTIIVPASTALNVKFGYIDGSAGFKVSVNGSTPAAPSLTSGVYTLAASEGVKEVVFTQTATKTVVFKQIMVGEDIKSVQLPWLVTYDAGEHGTCATAKEVWWGTALTLPTVTPEEGWSFDGWKDDENNAATSPYTPTKDVVLSAQYTALASPFDLTALTYKIGTAEAVNVGYVDGTFTYNIELPYAPSYDVITVAPTLKVNTSSIKEGAVLTVSSLPGAATFTVVANDLSEKLFTINFSKEAKDGTSLIKAVATATAQDITGTNLTGAFKGAAHIETASSYKLNEDKYFMVQLVAGQNFQAGDIVKINVSAVNDCNGFTLYSSDEFTAANLIIDTHDGTGVAAKVSAGVNEVELPSSFLGSNKLYVARAHGADKYLNAGINQVEVTRVLNPQLLAITIDERAGVIDPLDDKHFNVQIPYEADLANLTIVPTIAWNAPAAENSIVVNDGGAWVEGNNTYKLTDKDGDYTIYTLTLTRDVLKHTVSFNTHGGTAVASEEVVHGEYLAAAPAAPTKEDYIFQYWSLSDGGAEVDVTTVQIDEDKTFHAVWASDGGIKLIDGTTVNTTDYITGVSIVEDEIGGVKLAGTVSDVNSVKDLTRVIAYNAKSNQTKIQIKAYNTTTSDRTFVVKGLVEGATEAVELASITLGNKETKTSEWIEFNNADVKNRTIYIFSSSSASDIRFLQVKVMEDGANATKAAGEAGYILNFNKGRFFGIKATTAQFEGLSVGIASSDYQPLNSTVVKLNATSMKFMAANPVLLKVTTANNKTYYVDNSASGTANETAKTGESEFTLTAGTWFINAGAADVQITNIAFAAPKCEQPTITPMSNSDLCEGNAFEALTVTASVSDGGTLHYAWFKDAGETDEAVGTDAASYTPEADGEYYVIVTNRKDGFSDNSATSNTVTVTHYGAPVITSAPLNKRGEVDDVVTLTVAASGKNVAYKWYTCDEDGSNEEAIVPEQTGTSLDVTITAGMAQWYKVKVTSGCGGAEAKAKVTEFQPTAPANVTGSILWDWKSTAAGFPTTSGTKMEFTNTTDEELFADVDAAMPNNEYFRSDMLYGVGQYAWRNTNDGEWGFQGFQIKFHTTVAGLVRIYYRAPSSGNVCSVTIDAKSAGSRTNSWGWSEYVEVEANKDIVISMVNSAGADKMTRVQKIEFLEIIDSRTEYAAKDLGTACYEYDALVIGATPYMVAGVNGNGYIVFDEITSGVIDAGYPYLFEADGGQIFFCKPIGVTAAPLANGEEITVKGMVGTFTGTTLTQGVDDLCYFSGRHLWRVNDFMVGVPIPEHRCYVNYDVLKAAGPASAPAAGRRRISMGVNGENQAQGFENLDASEKPLKVMIDGTLYIIRGEKVFDATGRLVK